MVRHAAARTGPIALTLVFLSLLAIPDPADGQILRRLRDAAKSAAEDELTVRVQDLVRNAVRCVITDQICYEDARARGEEVIFTDEGGEIISDDDGAPITDRAEAASTVGVDPEAGADRPGEGVWANYDFVPGETVLFFEDYMADKVGDFPKRMEFASGNWEIVEWQGRRLLRNTGPRNAAVRIVLPRDLPERFTIETEAYFTHGNHQMVISTVRPRSNWTTLEENFFRVGNAHGTGLDARAEGAVTSVNGTPVVGQRLTPIRITVDGRYAKVYVGEQRVANVPNAVIPRSSEIWIENIYSGSPENPLYLGSFRIAEGGVDLYDRLSADGRVATRGILFGVNSDRIRPESTPTLKEIGEMLSEHPDLRIRIEGHTDATGDDASNMDLSGRRAEAVRAFLVQSYGIDAGRLEVEGLGETAPVDDNGTPEGRQNNRRVELVRLGG